MPDRLSQDRLSRFFTYIPNIDHEEELLGIHGCIFRIKSVTDNSMTLTFVTDEMIHDHTDMSEPTQKLR